MADVSWGAFDELLTEVAGYVEAIKRDMAGMTDLGAEVSTVRQDIRDLTQLVFDDHAELLAQRAPSPAAS